MNQSDATFELVKALTQNEKRHFRVFSQASGNDKNYLRVFDALDKMKNYDSGILKKKLAHSKINVSYEKNYLHRQLLKNLRTYYSENHSAIELQDILKTIEILYRKRLNGQCQKLVEKGIVLSKKFEHWHYHYELIEWQHLIYGRTGEFKKLMTYETTGLKEKEMLLETIRTYAHVQHLFYSALSVGQNQGISAKKEIKMELKNIIRKCLALLKNNKHSFRITELLYSALYLASPYSGNFKLSYQYALADYRLYNSYPHFKNDWPFKFFAALGNLISRCISLKKYKEGLKYVAELKTFLKHLPALDAQEIQQAQHSAVFGYEIRILMKNNRAADALIVTKEFERNYNSNNLRKGIFFSDSLLVAHIYFMNGLYKESLKRANELINENPEGVPLEYCTTAHLIRMAIHYDLNHYDVLERLAQSARRYMEKYSVNDDFASAFIETMKQVSKTDMPKKHRQIFMDHYLLLKKKMGEFFEQHIELVNWVEKKFR